MFDPISGYGMWIILPNDWNPDGRISICYYPIIPIYISNILKGEEANVKLSLKASPLQVFYF